jgi:hypothetical protein
MLGEARRRRSRRRRRRRIGGGRDKQPMAIYIFELY